MPAPTQISNTLLRLNSRKDSFPINFTNPLLLGNYIMTLGVQYVRRFYLPTFWLSREGLEGLWAIGLLSRLVSAPWSFPNGVPVNNDESLRCYLPLFLLWGM